MSQKQQYQKNTEIKISKKEKEILKEIVQSEKANLEVFSLPNKRENEKYKNILGRLNNKLS